MDGAPTLIGHRTALPNVSTRFSSSDTNSDFAINSIWNFQNVSTPLLPVTRFRKRCNPGSAWMADTR